MFKLDLEKAEEQEIKLPMSVGSSKKQNGCLRRPYIPEKRTEVKGNGEKERYTHLNAEFQRIARRDKKAFLSDQRRKIE